MTATAAPTSYEEDRPQDHQARIAEYVKRVVDAAPALSDDQRSRLTALLRPTGDRGQAA
jgi:hypothetical protein